MTSDYRESFSKNTFLPSLPPRGMETDGRRINRGGGAENSPLPRVSIRRKTASNLRELVYCWRAKWESGRKTTLVPPNEKWFGGWKGNGGFFFPPFFLSFPPLVTRLFFQGNIKCEFFSSVFFVGYFFEFRCCCCSCCCYRCWPSIRLGMIVSIQRFANVCPCLIECRGYTIVRIFDIVLFFLFFFSDLRD